MSKQPPAFTVRADEVCVGHFIVLQSTTPVPRPIITRVTGVEQVGDDIILTTTHMETTTSEGNLITCLGTVLEIR